MPQDTRKFPRARIQTIIRETLEQALKLNELKGGEYSGDDDALANFRRNGETLRVPMETVWAVYANKHHDSILQFIKDLNAGQERVRSESLAGRADDLIVYLCLFKAMLEERNGGDFVNRTNSSVARSPS